MTPSTFEAVTLRSIMRLERREGAILSSKGYPMDKKWFLKSKTVWFNVLVFAMAYFGLGIGDAEGFSKWAGEAGGTDLAFAGIPFAELLLRFITTKPVGSAGKSIVKSKTVLFNVLVIVVLLVLLAQPDPPVESQALVGLLAVAGINLVLRFSTDSGIKVLPVGNH